MLGNSTPISSYPLPTPLARLSLAIPILLAAGVPASAGPPQGDPLSFFEGRTETAGTIRVLMRKPYRTRSVGHGRMERDGSLTLVQRVHDDDGQPSRERRWKVRRLGAQRFTAAMTEAVGPVQIDKVGQSYRFRFKMKGNLTAEQWMTLLPGGRSARNTLKVRRMGITVATSTGVVRKV